MQTDNRVLARRYFVEIMNMADMDALYELLAPDFLFTLPTHPDPYRGPDGFKELVTMLHTCFPDFYIHVQDMVANGDTVVTRWRGGGTHVGGTLQTVNGDIPPSGRKFEIDGMTWHRMQDGKIVESLANEDTVGFLQQLGVIPAPPPPPPTPEVSEKLVGRYFDEIMNQGNLDAIPEVMDPNCMFIIPTQPEPIRGHEGFGGFVQYLRNAFPDIHFLVERQIVEDDKVAARWKITGTHKGEFLGAAGTNRKVEDHGVDIFTVHNGRILTVHVNENDLGLIKQLGIIPA